MYCKRYVEGNAGGSTIIQADYGKVYLSVYTTPLFVVDCLDTSGERVPRGNFSAYQSTVTPGTTIHRCYALHSAAADAVRARSGSKGGDSSSAASSAPFRQKSESTSL